MWLEINMLSYGDYPLVQYSIVLCTVQTSREKKKGQIKAKGGVESGYQVHLLLHNSKCTHI